MNIFDLLIIIINLAAIAGLYFLAGYATKVISTKWRICYIFPAIICLAFVALKGYDVCMLPAYIGSVLPIAGFINEKERVRKLSGIASATLIVIAVPICLLNKGYRAADYVQDFKDGFECMQKHYVLAEHKGADWDALYEEYLPLFKEADREQDAVANYIAWMKFCAEFHDGHVGYVPQNADYIEDEMKKRLYGNDYGLSLVTLADGRIAAVSVDESLAEHGITTGTIITKWDGTDPLEVARQSESFLAASFADRDNEAFYLAAFAAGVGGDSVTVTYLDENGTEKEAVLPKIGRYADRVDETLKILNGGVETGHFMWTDIDDKTACLRIKAMMFDSDSAASGDFSQMKNGIIEKLDEYSAKGVENIVLDMRCNSGGDSQVVKAIAEIFAPVGEHYYATDGKWDDEAGCYLTDPETGRFVKGKDNYFTGENLWDGNVIILVNANSVSAADHLTYVMQGMENVTVVGFTEPNGSSQGIGGIKLENGQFIFSNALLLDENGDVLIDSGADYESGNDIDIRVPLDEEAIEALFVKGEDYLMQKALAAVR
ncbi:MAG: peptidase S41 [Oscillospiraceae bacterium]|nr:peptidase S41 [Oscillospiraceae bacterium]